MSDPGAWVRYDDPRGFRVQHPAGWTVQADDATRRILLRGPSAGLFVLAQPFAGDAARWIQGLPAACAGVFPQARVRRTQALPGRTRDSIGELEFTADGVRARANFMCTGEGSGGVFYAMAAPDAHFEAWREALVFILDSLRFGTNQAARAQGGPSEPALSFVRWADPLENAFSLEVPRGWRVDGGTFRATTVDVRVELRVDSPDDRVRIRSGDRNIPSFALPTAMLAFTGLREGSWYSPGYGTQMMVRSYLPGARFASDYLQRVLQPEFGAARIENERELSAPSVGFGQQVHQGEVQFSIGSQWRGRLFASTTLMGMPDGSGLWFVTDLLGYLAQPGSESLAETVVGHMRQTAQINQQWAAAQQGMTAQTNATVAWNSQWQAQHQQQISQTLQETSEIVSRSHEQRQAVQDDVFRRIGNTNTGQTDVLDASTGETWKLESGSNHYWRDAGSNVIVGTNTYDSPGINFTPLREY